MASGIQTIANEGVHLEPYYVEYIDDAARQPRCTRTTPVGTQVLDRQAALTTIDVLKGVLTTRHRPARARRLREPQPGGVRQDRHAGRTTGRRSSWAPRRSCRPRSGPRPRQLHADGEHPRVQRGRRATGAGRHVPGSDLAGVHGADRARARRARRRTGSARGRPLARRHACTCRATSACSGSSGSNRPRPRPTRRHPATPSPPGSRRPPQRRSPRRHRRRPRRPRHHRRPRPCPRRGRPCPRCPSRRRHPCRSMRPTRPALPSPPMSSTPPRPCPPCRSTGACALLTRSVVMRR